MEEYYTTAIQSSLHHFDYFSAQWLAERLVDHCTLNNSHQSIKIPASIQLARVFIAQGEFPRALAVLSTLPKTEEVLYYICHCHLQLVQYDQADPLLFILIPALEQLIIQANSILSPIQIPTTPLPNYSNKLPHPAQNDPELSRQVALINQMDVQKTEISSITYPFIKYNVIAILSTFTPLLAHSYRIKGTIERRLGKFELSNESFKASLRKDSTIWASLQNLCELKVEPSETLRNQIPELFFNCKEHVPIFYQSPLAEIVVDSTPTHLSPDQLCSLNDRNLEGRDIHGHSSITTQPFATPQRADSLQLPPSAQTLNSHKTPKHAQNHPRIITPTKHQQAHHHLQPDPQDQLLGTPQVQVGLVFSQPKRPASSMSPSASTSGSAHQHSSQSPQRSQTHKPSTTNVASNPLSHNSIHSQSSQTNAATPTLHRRSSSTHSQNIPSTPPKRLVDEVDMVEFPTTTFDSQDHHICRFDSIDNIDSNVGTLTVLGQRTHSKLRRMNADLSEATHTPDKYSNPGSNKHSGHSTQADQVSGSRTHSQSIHTNMSHFGATHRSNQPPIEFNTSPIPRKVDHHYRSSWKMDEMQFPHDANVQPSNTFFDLDGGEGYDSLHSQRIKRHQSTPNQTTSHHAWTQKQTEHHHQSEHGKYGYRLNGDFPSISQPYLSYQRIHNMYSTNQFELQSMIQQQHLQQQAWNQSSSHPSTPHVQVKPPSPNIFNPDATFAPICIRGGISSLYTSVYSSSFFSPSTQHCSNTDRLVATMGSNATDLIDQSPTQRAFSTLTTLLPQTFPILSSNQPPNHSSLEHQSNRQNQSHSYNSTQLTPFQLYTEIKCHADYLHKIATAYMYSIHYDFINSYHTLRSLTQTHITDDVLNKLLSTTPPPPSSLSTSLFNSQLPHRFHRLKYANISSTLFYLMIHGTTLSNINESQRAAEVLKKLHQTYPWNVKGMDLYSNQLHLIGNTAALGALTTHLTTIAPRAYESLIVLGNHFSLQKQPENAIRCFALATTTNNNNINNNCHHANIDQSYPFLLLGYEYQAAEQLDKAILSFHRVIAIDPFNFKALLALAQIALNEESPDRHEQAIVYFKQAIRINKYSLHSYLEFAKMYGQLGMFKDTKEVIFKAIQCACDISLYLDFNPEVILKMFHNSLNTQPGGVTDGYETTADRKVALNANHFLQKLPQRGFFVNKLVQQLSRQSLGDLTGLKLPDNHKIPTIGSNRLQIYHDSQDSSQSRGTPQDAFQNPQQPHGSKSNKSQIIETGRPQQTTKVALEEPYNLIQLRGILSHIFFSPTGLDLMSCPDHIQSKHQNPSSTSKFITQLCALMLAQQTLSNRILLPLFIYIIHHCEEIILTIQTIQQYIDLYHENNPHHYLPSHAPIKQTAIQDKYNSILPYITALYHSIQFITLLLSIQPEEATFFYVLAKVHYSLHNIFNWSMKTISLYSTYQLPDLQQLHIREFNKGIENEPGLHFFNAPLSYINHEQTALNHITNAINLAESQHLEAQSTPSVFNPSLSLGAALLGPSSVSASKHHAIVIATTRQDSINPNTGTANIDFHNLNHTSSSTSSSTLSQIGRSYIELHSAQLSLQNHTQSVAGQLAGSHGSSSLNPTQFHLNSLFNAAQNDAGYAVQLPYTISSNNNNLNTVATNHYNVVCINPQQQIKSYTFNHRLYKLLQLINEQSFVDVGLYGVALDA